MATLITVIPPLTLWQGVGILACGVVIGWAIRDARRS